MVPKILSATYEKDISPSEEDLRLSARKITHPSVTAHPIPVSLPSLLPFAAVPSSPPGSYLSTALRQDPPGSRSPPSRDLLSVGGLIIGV